MITRAVFFYRPLSCRLIFVIAIPLGLMGCQTSSAAKQNIDWLAECLDLPLDQYSQELRARTQCGVVTAPLDHLDPAKGTITFGITRVSAKNPDVREGAILTNPGGPGSASAGIFAVHLASVWEKYAQDAINGDGYQHLLARYDVVEITPRGVGGNATTTLECHSEESIAHQNDATEDRSSENVHTIGLNAAVVARGCQAQAIAPYINTDQTARDMEFVRIQLKQDKLHYLGNSYGTWLGAWYASLFPGSAGRMVLDSSLDWTSPLQMASLVGAPEKERIFNHLVATPAAKRPQIYRLGDDPQTVREGFLTLLPAVRAAARLNYAEPENLMAAITLSAWLQQFPDRDADRLNEMSAAHVFSPDLMINERAKALFGELTLAVFSQAPNEYFEPGPLRLSGPDSVRSTVLCNDSVSGNDDFWVRQEDEYAEQFPVGGSLFMARHCAQWSGVRPERPAVEQLAQVESLLMVQAEYDDQTPAAGALRTFEQTANAHMVFLEGEKEHGVSFSDVSSCVNQLVGEYLAYGIKPDRLTVCKKSDATAQEVSFSTESAVGRVNQV
ncbi:alpha/beta fold hydrolase [Pseudomonas fluorescens]|uniref:Tripeptidyl aminopeptidase n=1 Tax=Pseudomonas fluorescens TaxID=294 RepID=A0A5E7CCQ2_PSEFL|nr:alpha/beta fold hydrolase [Pseudomonas fluorescens]VVN93603.1 Tripeptidyl aminopeptidase [Pseudomonas fluorescens]